jgi:hypothetical protein
MLMDRIKLKFLLMAVVILFSTIACSNEDEVGLESDKTQVHPELGVNISLSAYGNYPITGEKIYVDKNLNPVSKSKAIYYLEKELLGRDLVPNDDVTGNYWEDKKYFKNTPIINYIYIYHRVDNDNIEFAANASELEGTTQYLFNGLAFWYEGDKVKVKGGYFVGDLDGEFIVYNSDGTVKGEYGFDRGRFYSNMQDTENIYTPLIGLWEAELYNDNNFQLRTQVFDLKNNGSMEFYHNIYYGDMSENPKWELSEYGQDTKAKGSWKFSKGTGNTGVMEFYYKGEIAMCSDIYLVSDNELTMKITLISPFFNSEYGYVGLELRFLRK